MKYTISKSELIQKNKIRFIIVTDIYLFYSIDKKNNTTLDIEINQLSKKYRFYLITLWKLEILINLGDWGSKENRNK